MEVTMLAGIKSDTSGICQTSPVEFFFLTQRIEREARAARDAAIGRAVVQAFAAAVHGVRWLSSIVHDAFALRDTLMPARQRCRTHYPNHYQ
jgi:hypothetical protein